MQASVRIIRVERTSSLSPKASSAVTVQSRYSWMVAILGASTKEVFRPRGGLVCRQRQCIDDWTLSATTDANSGQLRAELHLLSTAIYNTFRGAQLLQKSEV